MEKHTPFHVVTRALQVALEQAVGVVDHLLGYARRAVAKRRGGGKVGLRERYKRGRVMDLERRYVVIGYVGRTAAERLWLTLGENRRPVRDRRHSEDTGREVGIARGGHRRPDPRFDVQRRAVVLL